MDTATVLKYIDKDFGLQVLTETPIIDSSRATLVSLDIRGETSTQCGRGYLNDLEQLLTTCGVEIVYFGF